MEPYNIFFFGSVFFLAGVGLESLKLNFWILIITAALAAVFVLFGFWKKNRRFFWIAGLSAFIAIGALYSAAADRNFAEKYFPKGETLNFQGLIVNNPAPRGSSQSLYVRTKLSGAEVKILVKAERYPEFHYGDLISVNGAIKKPESEGLPEQAGLPAQAGYAQYLAKEGISGVVSYPEVNLIAENKGAPFKSFLFNLKNSIVDRFGEILPAEEAAFLSGLTLGERSDFSPEFKEALQTSGTTHLVALSGYNVSIVIVATMALLTSFLKRRIAFIVAFIFLVAFVLMTGAEASVVRAAIMGALVVIATESGRIFNPRNAITLAGLLMVLINPKVLVFDAGFELSFLALIGIVYLKPALEDFFNLPIGGEKGTFSWRENLLMTSSAQLLVAPILIQSFGNFSPISLVSNVLILEFIPYTMMLGFAVAVFSGISHYLALIGGWFVWPLLKIETGLIEFFGNFNLSLNMSLSWILIIIYYLVIAIFIVKMSKKNRLNNERIRP
ncbi:MAG: ComEC/Rec2 family competence protein [Patescibacteria group bacterium]